MAAGRSIKNAVVNKAVIGGRGKRSKRKGVRQKAQGISLRSPARRARRDVERDERRKATGIGGAFIIAHFYISHLSSASGVIRSLRCAVICCNR